MKASTKKLIKGLRAALKAKSKMLNKTYLGLTSQDCRERMAGTLQLYRMNHGPQATREAVKERRWIVSEFTLHEQVELGRTHEYGFRKARMDKNACVEFDDGKRFAVFQHTFYLGKWYYDGYRAFATVDEAIDFRDKWLHS